MAGIYRASSTLRDTDSI
uniref:Uncharacterized protein n=1 Tax=Anguilla anguilla TaxID=7936 RepID=A0A0E9VX11_ANGAN